MRASGADSGYPQHALEDIFLYLDMIETKCVGSAFGPFASRVHLPGVLRSAVAGKEMAMADLTELICVGSRGESVCLS